MGHEFDGFIKPSPDDSDEQKKRWADLERVKQEGRESGVKNINEISRLTGEIRKEWQNSRTSEDTEQSEVIRLMGLLEAANRRIAALEMEMVSRQRELEQGREYIG